MDNLSQSVIWFSKLFSAISIAIISVITLIYKIKGLDRRSLENIKKRYEYYKEIIINMNNKALAYTGLKEYIGFSITNAFAEHIIKSKKFYEIINVLKVTYDTHIEFDSTTNKIKYKNNRKPNRAVCVFFYFICLLPIILFLSFLDKIIIHKEYLIVLTILVIPWLILAALLAIEVGNRTLVINLMKKLDDE
jgi:hypothetical protein